MPCFRQKPAICSRAITILWWVLTPNVSSILCNISAFHATWLRPVATLGNLRDKLTSQSITSIMPPGTRSNPASRRPGRSQTSAGLSSSTRLVGPAATITGRPACVGGFGQQSGWSTVHDRTVRQYRIGADERQVRLSHCRRQLIVRHENGVQAGRTRGIGDSLAKRGLIAAGRERQYSDSFSLLCGPPETPDQGGAVAGGHDYIAVRQGVGDIVREATTQLVRLDASDCAQQRCTIVERSSGRLKACSFSSMPTKLVSNWLAE